jgi:hypothetical protein
VRTGANFRVCKIWQGANIHDNKAPGIQDTAKINRQGIDPELHIIILFRKQQSWVPRHRYIMHTRGDVRVSLKSV